MKTTLKISTFLALLTNISFAQPTYEWAGKLGGSQNEYGNNLTTDAAGNVYTVGYFEGTVDFDPGAGVSNLTSAGLDDIFITKMDSDGILMWARRIGGVNGDYGYAITLDASGNIFTTGIFTGTVDFNPGGGTFNLVNPTTLGDAFISKLDNDGNFIWAKQFTSATSSGSWGESISLDASENIYISGAFQGTVDFNPAAGTTNLTAPGAQQDIYIVKLDVAGNLQWAKRLGTTNYESTQAGTVDAAGNFYITGFFQLTMDSDPGAAVVNVTATGGLDIFIVKLNTSGNFVWSRSIGGIGNEYTFDVKLDASGNFYATGRFQSTVDFDPGAAVNNLVSAGGYDGFVLKLNSSGDYTWAKQFGGAGEESPLAMSLDQSGNSYITGLYQGTADFDPGAGTNFMTAAGLDDIFLSKLDIDGNFVWGINIGASLDEGGQGITVDANYNIYSTGYFENTIDFDPGSGTANLTSVGSGNYDAFVYKYAQCNNDLIDPVANNLTLSDLTNQCSMTSLTAPTATDNCAGIINGTHNATLPITAQGTTIVTWTYDDGNGNSITQNQNVIIDDNTNPVPTILSLADITNQCSVSSLTSPTANDNCSGIINGTHNATLPINGQGTTIVTWTYDDGNGNSITQNQNVIIDDNTNPVPTILSLADITNQCSVSSLTSPTANDNCAGVINGTHNAILPITAQGTTMITWTYDDGNGNSITQNQNVIIDDNTNPVPTILSLADITNECSVSSLTTPTATDNCIGTISGTHNAVFPITASGTTIVTWTFDDGNGNSITQNQNVIITPIDNSISLNLLTLSAIASGYTYQWIDCGNGNAAIVGETNQTFTATLNGIYAVEISNGTCMVTSICTAITEVGIIEMNENQISLYPNPANSFVVIQSNDTFVKVELINLSGQLVAKKLVNGKTTEMDLTAIASGTYFIKIVSQNAVTIEMFIKE